MNSTLSFSWSSEAEWRISSSQLTTPPLATDLPLNIRSQRIACNFILAALFLPGVLNPGQSATVLSHAIPLAFIVFTLFHGLYWMGNGIVIPTATPMMADVSEINEIRTGINKDGAYAAVFSFAQKCAISLAVLITGYSLTFIGFEPGKEIVQAPETVWRLCAVTLIAGPLVSLVSLGLIRLYPVSNELLEKMREGKERV